MRLKKSITNPYKKEVLDRGNILKSAYTILHISDLHRNEDGRVLNDQLYSSLTLDSENYTSTRFENIPSPSIIIVSGDLVFGSSKEDIAESTAEMRVQYEEASEFLELLVKKFLNGDKSRIIIVPGNHDVQWAVSKSCMTKVDHSSLTKSEVAELSKMVRDSKKDVRWNWQDLHFYRINNLSIYNSRMSLFAEFYSKFYEYKRTYSTSPHEQYDVFDIRRITWR